MRKRIALLLAAIMIIVVLLPGCSTSREKTALKVGTRPHNGMYNPLYATSTEDIDVCNLVFEGLTTTDENGKTIVNTRLVENYATSSDNKSYVFVLKEGVTFANGEPVTASDILFTYKTLADPSSTAANKEKILFIENAAKYTAGKADDLSGVQVMNERTIMFTFTRQDSGNLDACGVKILSEKFYPNWEMGNVDFAMMEKMHTPLGSGPYVVNDIQEDKVIMHLNPTYWAMDDSNYSVEAIEIKYITDEELPQAFASGEVDFVQKVTNSNVLIELGSFGEVGDGYNLDFMLYDTDRYAYIGFDTSVWYSKSWTIRRAIAYSFNRDEFIENCFSKYGTKINSPIPNDSQLYKEISGRLEGYPYDPEKARELLASVNYVWDDEGVMQFEGSPVTMIMFADIASPVSEALIEQLKKDLDALGIELIVEYYDNIELAAKLREPGAKWNMYFTEDNWHAEDRYAFLKNYTIAGIPETNVTKYQSGVVEALVIQLIMTPNMDESLKQDIYGEILLDVNTYLPELPIYTRQDAAIVSTKVSGLNVGRYKSWSESIENVALNVKENQ